MTSAAFVEEFLRTLTPGVIPREQFINWERISEKCRSFEVEIEYFGSLAAKNRAGLRTEIRDALLSSDDPYRILKAAFELLGHTGEIYVSDHDNVELSKAAEVINQTRSEETADLCAGLLVDLGLSKMVDSKDLPSTFLGVQVGLESNRRKNVGGEAFNEWVRRLLESTCGLLGADFTLLAEHRIQYKDSENGKKVDFAVARKGKVRVGVEANFYTGPGSKPTEIKRAYATVSREFGRVGVELVWITDGAGYLKMKKSLEEAFEIHPNIFNFDMASRYLKEDILDLLQR